MLQVPDSVVETDEKIHAVVLDEEAVGAPDGNGCNAKILRGEGALDMYLSDTKNSSKVIKPDYPYWLPINQVYHMINRLQSIIFWV